MENIMNGNKYCHSDQMIGECKGASIQKRKIDRSKGKKDTHSQTVRQPDRQKDINIIFLNDSD